MSVPRIVRIPILPLSIVNAHVVIGPDGCVLVDAGLPGTDRKLGRALAREGLSFTDIKLIVVTHAHVDHAGGAARARELSGAPIVAHVGDLPHYTRDVPMTFCPTGVIGSLFHRTDLPREPYTPFAPDILLRDGEGLSLDEYGVPGRIASTPGHTRGSISVVLTSGEALVGDLVAAGILIGGILRNGHARRPPFEDDPRAVAGELARLLDGGATRFHLGHGGPLPATEVRRHAEQLAKRPNAPPTRADARGGPRLQIP